MMTVVLSSEEARSVFVLPNEDRTEGSKLSVFLAGAGAAVNYETGKIKLN
jgi:hypothetical protein